MNIDYFKERFKNIESTYLLARRANSPDLNPHALRAIEEIITARDEVLPVLVPFVESATTAESKSDKFWRFTATIAASIGLIVILKTFTTGFIQEWAGTLVWSVLFAVLGLLWLRTVKNSLRMFVVAQCLLYATFAYPLSDNQRLSSNEPRPWYGCVLLVSEPSDTKEIGEAKRYLMDRASHEYSPLGILRFWESVEYPRTVKIDAGDMRL